MAHVTKYELLFRELENYLDKLAPGERLLPVREMRTKFGISLATLNSALQMLENTGRITREPYRGIYKSHASRNAGSLLDKRSVVLLLPGWSEPLFLRIITECSRRLHAAGIQLNLCVYEFNEDSEVTHLQELSYREAPTGVLYMPTFDTGSTRTALRVLSSRCPVVQLDRFLSGEITPAVHYGSFEASYTATEQLILAGCRRVGMVSPLNMNAGFRARVDGFNAALEHHGLKNDAAFNITYDEINLKCSTDISRLMRQLNPPDGFFCCNAVFLPTLLNQLQRANVKIPEQVAVTTFDITDTVKSLPLAMTYVEEPADDIASSAVNLLLQMLENPWGEHHSITVPGRFCPGESCVIRSDTESISS